MRLTSRLRRAIIFASIGTAAVLLPTIALASSAGTSTTANTAALHRCYQPGLTAWLGIPGSGAAGSVYYELELSNTSGQTCTLYGYPGVSALLGGVQMGSAAGRTASHPKTLVTLAPGATAHVILQLTNVANYPTATCKPVTATALRVYPPGATAALRIPFPVKACSIAGPVYLHVSATIGGTGIPGHSV
ncbi:MAG: DUF4232 domain-containing protein [Actinobacteria bacterium]|nr:DUF4232 domain-containing protein [Actinomycetota bacterium]MBO0835150.1 DUF4232 domain-containing protein [Actinomycetota bacterium]